MPLFINSVTTNFDAPADDLKIIAQIVNSADTPVARLALEFKSETEFTTHLEILSMFDKDLTSAPIVNYAHLQLCIMNTLHRASDHNTEIPYAPEIDEPLPVIID